jgi:dihydrodipicolinate synthase/N-acetylneuraminate lyase
MTSAVPDDSRQPRWQGVFAILCTPFSPEGQLDLRSLEREIEFCLNAQTHGLVALVNASEYWTLSDEERTHVAEVTIKQVGGTVPVIIGVSSGSADWSVNFARHAQDCGADGVMAMPPTGRPTNELESFRYYEKLSSVLDIPMFVQNHDPPLGTRMSPALVSRVVRELPHADWIKEETLPPGHAMSIEIASCGAKLQGIMGGIAGRYLFDEYARGACGTMPACESVDVHVLVWNALTDGDHQKAREYFSRLLPLLNYEAISSGVYKAVLRWRGVIESDYVRTNLANPLDAHDRRELAVILRSLQDLYVVAPLREDLVGSDLGVVA